MRKPLLIVALLMMVASCGPPPAAPDSDEIKSSTKVKPGAKSSGTGGTGTGTGSGGTVTGVPTGKPTTGGSGGPTDPKKSGGEPLPSQTPPDGKTFDRSPQPAELALELKDRPGNWSIKPYLNRGRAGHVVGSLKDRLIVAEGDHRPSYEYLAIGATSWVIDDSYDQELGATAERLKLHQGISLAVGGVLNGVELWSAGGLTGNRKVDGTAGVVSMYLYRDSGFSSARTVDQGGFFIKHGRFAAAGGIVEDTFVACGGVFNHNTIVTDTDRTLMTKLFSNQSQGKPMPVPVAGAASAVAGSKLYVVGGYTFTNGKPTPVKNVQVYDLTTDTWAKDGEAGAPPALPDAVHSAAAAVLDGTLYVAGGYGADGKVRGNFLSCGADGGTWGEAPAMPTPRALLQLTVHQGLLWAIGGVGADRVAMQTVETYQP